MLQPADLLEPKGDLLTGMFPTYSPEALNVAISEWLAQGRKAAQGLGEGPQDEAAMHFAYAKAYRNVYNRMSSSPIRLGVEAQMDAQYDKGQAARFLALAEQHEAAFNGYVTPQAPGPQLPGTISIPLKPVW